MNKKYQRLRAEDRKVIENLRQAGSSQAEIGLDIGFSQSTISKELARNRGERGYFRGQADEMAVARLKQKKSRPRIIIGEFTEQVKVRLRIKQSPDQLSQSLRKVDVRVSDGDGCEIDEDECKIDEDECKVDKDECKIDGDECQFDGEYPLAPPG